MKRILLIALVLILVLGVGFVGYRRILRRRAIATSNLSTATVQVASLLATVESAGNITAHQQVNLNFMSSGIVQKVNAQVGEHVSADQVLAELDTTDLNLQIQNAQVNLKIAQDKLAQTRNPTTTQDIASARARLESAQANYAKLSVGPTQPDLAAAQASVASGQANYDAVLKSTSTANTQLSSAYSTLQKAQASVQQAQAAYDKIASRPDAGMTSQALTLQQATIDCDGARTNYDALVATSGTDAASKVAQARSQLQQAQSSLTKLQTPPTDNDLIASRSQVTQAQNDLDKLLAGPDANALDIAQNNVEQAQIALQQAQARLQQARVVAPFAATVVAVNITPGQTIGANVAGGAVQLADLDHLEIVVNMAEVDIGRLLLNQEVNITLDAVPDLTLTGQTVQIAPAGVATQGVVSYPVTVAIQNPPATVKTGMTANVSIIVDRRDNVLVLPNRAVKTQGLQHYVTVLYQGTTFPMPVTIGMSNDSQTEILTGVKEGDTIVVSGTTTTTTQPRTGALRLPGAGLLGLGAAK